MAGMTGVRLDPTRTAVLLMDLQTEILGMVDDVDGYLERVVGVTDAARALGATIGYVRVAFTPEARAAIPDTSSFAAVRDSDRLAVGSPEAAIDTRVAPRDGDIVVTKVRVGAFSTTDLADQLDAAGIDTLVLCGIATSGVVLSTVRDGADRDFRIVVVADCCADRDPEVHRVLTKKVFPRQATVVDAAEVFALLGGSDGAA
jgi:nicotinamidase-related amidase